MEQIKDTKFYQIFYDKDNQLAEYRWKETILDLNEDDYKDILIEAYDLLFKLTPILLIQNFKNAVYPVTPEFQDWLAEHISKERFEKVGIKKVAYVMPEDIITKIGVELLVEHAQYEVPSIVRLYFDNLKDATSWLLKKTN